MKYFYCVALLFLIYGNNYGKSVSPIRILNTYPINDAQNVNPSTGIGITFSTPIIAGQLSKDSFSVQGLTKTYFGSLKISRNGRTLIFKPSTAFSFKDTIKVRIGGFETVDEQQTPEFTMTFYTQQMYIIPDPNIHSDDPLTEIVLNHLRNNVGGNSNQMQQNDSDLTRIPQMNILVNKNPSAGNMFFGNFKFISGEQLNTFRIIYDRSGNILDAEGGGPDYYQDYKPYADGTISYFDVPVGAHFILDSNLSYIRTISPTYGYQSDPHEIRKTAEGNYYIICDADQSVDMTQYIQGGFPTATVLVPIIQEFDADSNLIFEWRSIDHFKITDATHEDLRSSYIDFCHMNAIEFDADSNLLISSRHLDEITKIDRETGNIIWRWGGKNNQFTFVGDTLLFSHQHAIRRTTTGTYTMFDNGNNHTGDNQYSRALEYRLDQTNKIATKVWEFRHTPDIYSSAMGYVQRLLNQNTFIGWGDSPGISVTEVDPENQTVFEMGMADSNLSYRAYKYDSTYLHGIAKTLAASAAPQAEFSLSCMPNPITNLAQVQCSMKDFSIISISLFDQLGREVSKIYTGNLSEGIHSFTIDSKTFPAGMYYLRATGSNGIALDKKIIVMK